MAMALRERAQALGKASLHLADPLLDSIHRKKKSFSSASNPKITEAFSEILTKLCTKQEGRYTYAEELDELAKKQKTTGPALLASALDQLQHSDLELDRFGRPVNASAVGADFATVLRFIQKRVSLFVVLDGSQLPALPLSERHQGELAPMLKEEAVILLLVRLPPEPARREMEQVSADQFHGLTLWLQDRRMASISRELDNYLEFATVRILCTGHGASASLAKSANELLESDGFEKNHLQRVIASTFESEKNESLAGVLKVSALVIAGVKALEHFYPHLVHIVGGILDDLFGAILPDVSQSWGRTGRFIDKFKRSFTVFAGGSLGLPVSFLAGWASSSLYSDTASTLQRMAAGICFAFACAAGTVGTSIAATVRAYKGVKKYEEEHGMENGFWKRFTTAFDEALLKVPFRIGHTLVALPLQLGLGALAGALCFFNSTVFITLEGVMESMLGAAFAFIYPKVADRVHQRKLRGL